MPAGLCPVEPRGDGCAPTRRRCPAAPAEAPGNRPASQLSSLVLSTLGIARCRPRSGAPPCRSAYLWPALGEPPGHLTSYSPTPGSLCGARWRWFAVAPYLLIHLQGPMPGRGGDIAVAGAGLLRGYDETDPAGMPGEPSRQSGRRCLVGTGCHIVPRQARLDDAQGLRFVQPARGGASARLACLSPEKSLRPDDKRKKQRADAASPAGVPTEIAAAFERFALEVVAAGRSRMSVGLGPDAGDTECHYA